MPSQNTETTSTSTISRMIDLLKCMILPISPHWRREINNEIRNVMLVAAALIATVTFQAGITPPGGVWQNDDDKGHRAGRAVFSDQKAFFHIFLTFNTIALTSSISVLLCLTFGCPYFLEILIATICMVVTYTSGIQCIAPDEPLSFRLLFVAAPAPAVIRFVIWVVAYAVRDANQEEDADQRGISIDTNQVAVADQEGISMDVVDNSTEPNLEGSP